MRPGCARSRACMVGKVCLRASWRLQPDRVNAFDFLALCHLAAIRFNSSTHYLAEKGSDHHVKLFEPLAFGPHAHEPVQDEGQTSITLMGRNPNALNI